MSILVAIRAKLASNVHRPKQDSRLLDNDSRARFSVTGSGLVADEAGMKDGQSLRNAPFSWIVHDGLTGRPRHSAAMLGEHDEPGPAPDQCQDAKMAAPGHPATEFRPKPACPQA